MQWRGKLLIYLAVAFFIAILFLLSGRREPSCEGKTLTEWLKIYEEGGSADASPTHAAEAVRKIGTNALPVLLGWVYEDGERWQDNIKRTMRKLPRPLQPSPSGMLDRRQADNYGHCQTAFRLLGQSAYPAIPELKRVINHTNSFVSGKAMLALATMGNEGRRVLVEAVPQGKSPIDRAKTISTVSPFCRDDESSRLWRSQFAASVVKREPVFIGWISRFRGSTAIPILDGMRRRRSADWQSAVSPIGNRRIVYGHEAGCQPAIQPTASRRYVFVLQP